ncbi:BSU1 [Symbiodinium sp. CCMP2456]|nr:BSU1 [Symbiodinium sp. CCMP2456]
MQGCKNCKGVCVLLLGISIAIFPTMRRAIGCIDGAAQAIWEEPPWLLRLPAVEMMIKTLFSISWLIFFSFVITRFECCELPQDPPTLDVNGTPVYTRIRRFYIFVYVGYLWTLETLSLIFHFAASFYAVSWYFTPCRAEGNKVVETWLWRTGIAYALRYHLGSMAMGGFMTMLFRPIHTPMAVLAKLEPRSWLKLARGRLRGSAECKVENRIAVIVASSFMSLFDVVFDTLIFCWLADLQPTALGQPQGRKELSDAEIDVEFGRQPAGGPGSPSNQDGREAAKREAARKAAAEQDALRKAAEQEALREAAEREASRKAKQAREAQEAERAKWRKLQEEEAARQKAKEEKAKEIELARAAAEEIRRAQFEEEERKLQSSQPLAPIPAPAVPASKEVADTAVEAEPEEAASAAQAEEAPTIAASAVPEAEASEAPAVPDRPEEVATAESNSAPVGAPAEERSRQAPERPEGDSLQAAEQSEVFKAVGQTDPFAAPSEAKRELQYLCQSGKSIPPGAFDTELGCSGSPSCGDVRGKCRSRPDASWKPASLSKDFESASPKVEPEKAGESGVAVPTSGSRLQCVFSSRWVGDHAVRPPYVAAVLLSLGVEEMQFCGRLDACKGNIEDEEDGEGGSCELELVEGPIVIDEYFDFYDPYTKRAEVLALTEEVKHQRPALGLAHKIDIGDQSSDGSPLDALTPKTRARCEVEVLTKWGVIAGKLIFSQVLTLTTMSSIYVIRAQQARVEKNSRVWRRIEGRARRVVSQAAHLAARVIEEPGDTLHNQWRLAQGGALSELFTTEYVDTLMILAKASSKLVAVQPVLTEARVPCRIFGDIHGQLRDLLLIFAAFGFPGSKEDNLNDLEMSYVFNGDFVDRGAHSLEVIGLLLALKVSMPDRVWLVRGNHEDRTMNARYGFWEECHDRLGDTFGRKTYDLFQTTFDQLPIACLVANKILCVHGGVGDGRWDLNDLRAVRRPLSQQELCSAKLRWVHNILWSDPIEDDREQRSEESGPVFGVHESPRNTTAVLFGWDVTKTFCAKNGINMVVRSHQSKKDGIGVDVMHDNMLIRVFSARDYEGHGNDGAVLLVQPTDEGDAQCCDRPEQIMVRAQVLGSFAKATANASRGALYRLNVSQDIGR